MLCTYMKQVVIKTNPPELAARSSHQCVSAPACEHGSVCSSWRNCSGWFRPWSVGHKEGTLPPLLRIKASLDHFCRSRLAPSTFLKPQPCPHFQKFLNTALEVLRSWSSIWNNEHLQLLHYATCKVEHTPIAVLQHVAISLYDVMDCLKLLVTLECAVGASTYEWNPLTNAISEQEHNWLRKTQMHFISNCALVQKLHYQCTLQKSSATGWILPHCNETIFRPEMLCPTMEPSASQRYSRTCAGILHIGGVSQHRYNRWLSPPCTYMPP